MMETIKVCLAPFFGEDIPIIRYLEDFAPQFEISSVISPRGLGIENRDIGVIENRDAIGYISTCDIKHAIDKSDTVIILDRIQASTLYEYVISVMDEAIQQRKNIINLFPLSKLDLSRYKEQCKALNLNFVNPQRERLPSVNYTDISKPFYYPRAPVIFIGEITESAQSYEVLCTLINACKNNNIRVSVISAEKANLLFGFHSISFTDSKIALEQCVYRINKYIEQIEATENPNLIFIKLPKPMIKFDENVRYDFGISAYIISQAVSASYFIACGPLGLSGLDFWPAMSRNFESKFGYSINAIHLSNKKIDFSNTQYQTSIMYVHAPQCQVQETIERINNQSSILIKNLVEPDQAEIVLSEVIDQLIKAPYSLLT